MVEYLEPFQDVWGTYPFPLLHGFGPPCLLLACFLDKPPHKGTERRPMGTTTQTHTEWSKQIQFQICNCHIPSMSVYVFITIVTTVKMTGCFKCWESLLGDHVCKKNMIRLLQ